MTQDQEDSEGVARRGVLAYLVAICAGLSSMLYLSITGAKPAGTPDDEPTPTPTGAKPAGTPDDEPTPTPEPAPRERIYRLAENIEDHGGIADDDSVEAIEANVRAIHDASVAAENNTVYLPEGNWFIGAGDDDTGEALQPGCADVNEGAAGLGFVGEGPEKTFLYWGALDSDHNNNIRYCAADHSGATWKNLTYDGRWRSFASSGHDFSAAGQWGINIEGDASGDLTLENVRIQGMAGNGIFMGFGLDLDLTIDRCTFYDNGIGINRATGGNRHQHHIAAFVSSDSSLTVKNSEFRLCSGSVMDVDGSGTGTITTKNVYAEGAGVSFYKINDPGKIVDSNVYFRGETQELVEEMASTSRANYFYRLAGTDTYAPTIEMNDVEIVDCPGYGWRVSKGYQVTVKGGRDGPVAMKNVALLDNRREAISGNEGTLSFDDIGDVSVHDVNGDVAQLNASDGSIDTLRWAGANSLGNTGNVKIGNEIYGETPFAPVTPLQSDVGINSAPDIDLAG